MIRNTFKKMTSKSKLYKIELNSKSKQLKNLKKDRLKKKKNQKKMINVKYSKKKKLNHFRINFKNLNIFIVQLKILFLKRMMNKNNLKKIIFRLLKILINLIYKKIIQLKK